MRKKSENQLRSSSSKKTRRRQVRSEYQFEKLEDRKMLASIVESGGLVTVIASPQDDTVIISTTANPGFTDISVNYNQAGAVFGRFATSSIDSVLVFAGAGNDRVFSSSVVPTEVNGQAGNDILNGGSADDIIRGNSGNNRIVGNGGDDLLVGGGGADVILGGAGNDLLFGQAGVDRLFGQSGDDVLNAGDGNDRVIGGNGDDLVYGGDGNDYIAGNAGEDELFGNFGNDNIHGGPGNDLIAGREGNDSLYGNEGDDFLIGFSGDDLLLGLDGNDTLDGSEGVDRLIGGSGEDYLQGGFDSVADRLAGGAGNDTFVRHANDILEDVSNGSGLDSVLDVRGSDSQTPSDGGDDGDDGDGGAPVDSAALGVLLALFGPNLTGSISRVAFTVAAEGLGETDTFGNVSVVTVGERRFAFEEVSGGNVVLPGGLDSQVTLVGSFPATISPDFGIELAAFTQPTTTGHVVGDSLVSVDENGAAATIASVNASGALSSSISNISIPDFDIVSLISMLAGGGSLGSLIQDPGAPVVDTGDESGEFIFDRFVFDQETTVAQLTLGLGLQGDFLITEGLPVTIGGSPYINYDVYQDGVGNQAFILRLEDGRSIGYQDAMVMLDDVRTQFEFETTVAAGDLVQGAAINGLVLLAPVRAGAPALAGLRLNSIASLGEAQIAGTFHGIGKTAREMGSFFGWRGSQALPVSNFTRQGLLQQGLTRDSLLRIANGYDEIARNTTSAVGRASATARATQIRGLLTRFFPTN